MDYIVSKRITAASGAETYEDVFTTPVNERRRCKLLITTRYTDVWIRLYVENEQIIDVYTDLSVNDNQHIPLDIEVNTGELLKIGVYNTSGGSVDVDASIVYTKETTA